MQTDGTGSELIAFAAFADSDYNNRDFGIDAEQSAASSLAETDLDGGYRSFGFNYLYRENLTENWQLLGEVFYEKYSSDISDSPITRNNYEAEVGAALIYVF